MMFATMEEAYGPRNVQQSQKKERKKERSERQAARQRATVDALTSALPIATHDDEEDGNISDPLEGFSGSGRPVETFWGGPFSEGANEADLGRKLDRCLRLLESGGGGAVRSAHVVHEKADNTNIVMYTFTGLFMLFVLDNFVTFGKRMKRGS
jgi:hypothetical protein